MKIPEFKDKRLSDLAFTHRSYLNESRSNIESNERLEFLGDSILSFVVSTYIFKQYPQRKEGELTSLRSVLTNTETLFEVAKRLDLGRHLRLSKGEEEGGGRQGKTILANTYEAIVGALFLDQGLIKVEEFIHQTILSNIDELVSLQGLKDPKSRLQEVLQNKFRQSPTYVVAKEEGPDHNKTYTVDVYLESKLLGTGIGKSKQEAEKKAAEKALSAKI